MGLPDHAATSLKGTASSGILPRVLLGRIDDLADDILARNGVEGAFAVECSVFGRLLEDEEVLS